MRPHEAVPMQDSPFVARWIALARSMPDPLSPRYRSLLCLPLDPRFDALRAVADPEAVHAHDAASLERALREVDVATTVCLASLDAELDVPALCALAAALWPGVRVVRASSPETRLDRASGTYARPRRGARAAAPPAAAPQVYLATNKQASLLRMRERDHALRFIDRYELTDLDAATRSSSSTRSSVRPPRACSARARSRRAITSAPRSSPRPAWGACAICTR